MYRILIYIWLPFFLIGQCMAQNKEGKKEFICGTETPKNAKKYEQAYLKSLQNNNQYESISRCLNKTLSLNFIIVADSLYDPGVSISDINQGVTELNEWFAPICMSFQVCNVDTVYAYKYNRWDQNLEEDEFKALYCKENLINIVLVEEIEVPADAAGYAPLGIFMPDPPRKDLICIIKSAISGGKTFPHEMGHFFSLYHTFETSLGNELVNGNNCVTAGDLVCDTPADIDPAPIAGSCEWSGTDKDSNNHLYTPILGNIMSYHPGNCAGSFTIGQYNRMIFSYLNYRNYLY